MALARVQYTQVESGNRNFMVPFPYISKDHVFLSVEGDDVPYTWLNTTTVQLGVAPAVGNIIDVRRETERGVLLVDFQDASTITEQQLDLSAKQTFFIAQEAFDLTNSTMAVANDGSYSASGRRLSLLGYPDSNDDAANVQYVLDVLSSGHDAFVAREEAYAARDVANAARDKSGQWAVNPVDAPVEPGKFSAYHYATKAIDGATAAAQAKVDVENLKGSIEDSAEEAGVSAAHAQSYQLLARDWASKSGEPVEAGLYSAKHYAEVAAVFDPSIALWRGTPIGVPIAILDHITGCPVPPTDHPHFRYIKLTAGHAYNTGVLVAETVTGTSPTITASAEVNLPGSPLHGSRVPLLNTSGTFLRPSTAPGSIWDSQNLVHSHPIPSSGVTSSNASFSHLGSSSTYSRYTDPSGGPEAHPRFIAVSYYMRLL